MRVVQVKFRTEGEDDIFGGILLDDRYLICGCCGGVWDLKEKGNSIIIERVYYYWVDLSDTIRIKGI